ncbi:CidA/LrgA family protein [Clostridium saccharobutylicum]|uniref:LrgA family protein n=1 Tax=Clostridium saccharobutylicum DSM 13864 TaxID=1345695 RepID=U5MRA3_CLOSA|nr:CidA/LrgA family protein [Clostridium saccharobutylicum]AGX42206.1 LrgA family protein [Clostridium saccharobutylicum DSM 13864]AQR89486.1 antiholin-like protein LrgA [Clostridium saccharobutylicum]AQR99388.1 antiholin-like protein LrgA [Clostridium saccharobutylicum]AQS09119.1 antiholin-like protein LrgA [Clostridium saccharobutylicum]AQS13374.1 antiholin-like protein LrgA [Clostridium saccharobutylicum]
MKLFREALIILGIYLLGELLSSALHLPIPGNILGMIILFVLLCTKIIKVDDISNVTNFLLDHLSFFFIPAGVGLMTSMQIIKSTWWQLLIVCISTTVIIIGSTGVIVQAVSKRTKERSANLVTDEVNFRMKEGETIGSNN